MKVKRLAKFRSDRQVTLFRTYQVDRPEYLWGESQLERNTQRYYEYQQNVISYKEQPARYEYIDDKGVRRWYTPDLEIITAQGSELRETKPALFTRSARAKARFNHLSALFDEVKGTKISYITDEQVYAGHTTENLKKIHHFRRLNISKINLSDLFKALGKTTSFGELKAYIQSIELQTKYAFSLLGHQVFIFDYQLVLNEQTILTATGE
ncbi:hypothetical protein [Thalassotalea sp. PP2-459]|uniref:hypothetical protein n=1 Tax=Thalassotalea sp. PP2-459 TaxID=1742724 RepID=UPI000944D87D|nr:hypothetical protein [Thalassotalea sp. PP2-459]OKY25127.1 hypothetical protein BI291_03690 [Thalassotalea sp. PP2-459]